MLFQNPRNFLAGHIERQASLLIRWLGDQKIYETETQFNSE